MLNDIVQKLSRKKKSARQSVEETIARDTRDIKKLLESVAEKRPFEKLRDEAGGSQRDENEVPESRESSMQSLGERIGNVERMLGEVSNSLLVMGRKIDRFSGFQRHLQRRFTIQKEAEVGLELVEGSKFREGAKPVEE